MQLEDFTKYLDLSLRLGMAPRYQWTGRPDEIISYRKFRRIFFLVGAYGLTSQNFGVLIYFYLTEGKTESTTKFIVEMTEMTSALMLMVVGAFNIWALTYFRPKIEEVLTEFNELFPRPGERYFQVEHYYMLTTRFMRFIYIFYCGYIVYYNSVPLVTLLYEILVDGHDWHYKTQINIWHPWKVKGSSIGFSASFLSQAINSIVAVGFVAATQCIICLFASQLILHFDALSNQLIALDSNHPNAHRKLKKLIAYHFRILRIAERCNRVLNISFMSSLIGSTLAICMMSVAVLLLDFSYAIRYISGLIAFMIYHFTICYLGSEVTYASDKVLPAAFYNNWYEGDLAYRKMLLILMMRSSKSYGWRTYKLAPVSITTYMATLKFSYQMFTCVRSMK
ncbi:hypothetical protein KR009_011980 [Drosophila setifemur]|nr:hypothetical protein KR009_011980 [Drosophila setifemur]